MENNHKLPPNFAPASVFQSQPGNWLHQLERFVKKYAQISQLLQVNGRMLRQVTPMICNSDITMNLHRGGLYHATKASFVIDKFVGLGGFFWVFCFCFFLEVSIFRKAEKDGIF